MVKLHTASVNLYSLTRLQVLQYLTESYVSIVNLDFLYVLIEYNIQHLIRGQVIFGDLTTRLFHYENITQY